MAVIEEIQSAVRSIVEAVGPSVVGVGDRWAHGSGVVVAPGKVATNAHNLRSETVTITFNDGRTAEGTAAGVDVDGDLAVLSVDTGDAPVAQWRDGDGPGVGAPVFALANPGGRGLRVTFGIVSGVQRSFRGPRGRRIAGALEHTAPLLPGSSGGPTVDGDGRLLGLNTHRLGEGFYLAQAADASLKERVDALAAGQSPSRPRLGVGILPRHVARRIRRAAGLGEAEGLLVRYVEDGSPAEGAGIQQGDLITKAGGQAVAGPDDLHQVIDGLPAGADLELTILRGTEERTVSVKLGRNGTNGNGSAAPPPAEA
ncbi:MAG TPA: trypsin-like peptidase domain-containing protein [Actinomycetota bacterium]|nr:trypsin-like peptidase domain-containing protein [Actinomycetota bacterium]